MSQPDLRRHGSLLRAAVAALLACGPLGARAQEAAPSAPPGLAEVVARARPAVFTVLAQREVDEPLARPAPGGPTSERRTLTRVGSGVAIDGEGIILTTASVVLGAERISVRSARGESNEAVPAGVDPVSNVALLRVPGLHTAAVAFADPSSVKVGEQVITLGAAQRGLPSQGLGTIASRHPDPRHTLLQITNAVYPGNSGAAALDAEGRLLGIVQGELGSPDAGLGTDRSDRRGGGVGIVVPIETLARVVSQLRAEGRVRYGFLGVQTRSLSIESLTERGKEVPLGALVENVLPESPATRGGLRPGDLIVAFEGERVEYPGELARWVAGSAPGSVVELVWVRNDNRQSARFKLTEAPPDYAWGAGSTPERPVAAKIQELEQQIQRLSRELQELKNRSGQP